MARPRKYQSDAQRAAAYRKRLAERTVRVDRRTWEQLQQRLDRLQAAVEEAARSGDLAAENCYCEGIGGTLDLLAEHFEALRGWRRRHGMRW
jgi:outer membrane protein TolC